MIEELRKHLSGYLVHADIETWDYLPDDPNMVPCYVVAKPTLAINVQLVEATIPVWVIGRRMSDEDSQRQLDALADKAIALLQGSDVAVVRVEPGIATIGEASYPAYIVTCAIGARIC